MHRGYIKLYRKLLDWEWYTDTNTKVLFLHILIKANHTEKKWRGETIKIGSFITSLGNLANETGLTAQQVRTCLTKLEKTKEINKQGNNKNTVITVCNYESYKEEQQTNNKQDNKQVTNKQQTSNKQVTTTKNDKHYKNDKNDNIKAKFLPDLSALDNDKIDLLNEWLEYKKGKKQSYKAQAGITKLINEFNSATYDDVKEAIDKAIQNNYAGVFVNKSNSSQPKKGKTYYSDDDYEAGVK